MSRNYPTIENTYRDYILTEDDPRIWAAMKAVITGLTDDETLISALDELEESLTQFIAGDSVNADDCHDAELEVIAAWTDEIQKAVRDRRTAR